MRRGERILVGHGSGVHFDSVPADTARLEHRQRAVRKGSSLHGGNTLTISSYYAIARLVGVALLAATLGWTLAAQKYGREAAEAESEQASDTLAKLEARVTKLERDCSNAAQPLESPLIASLAALIKGQRESNVGAKRCRHLTTLMTTSSIFRQDRGSRRSVVPRTMQSQQVRQARTCFASSRSSRADETG